MLLEIDSGKEMFFPFAKKKLKQWKEQAARSGVASFARTIYGDEGTVINISSVALGWGRYNDRIRIKGGTHKYIQLLGFSPEAPLGVSPYDLVRPVITNGYNQYDGPQIAWYSEVTGVRAMYASASSGYIYSDEHGVSYNIVFGTLTGSTGVQWSISGPVVTDGAIYHGEYLGLPRYYGGTAVLTPWPAGSYTAFLNAMVRYYAEATQALIRQLSGTDVSTAAVHDMAVQYVPGGVPDGTIISFYYVSTESSLNIWGAFGVPPSPTGTQADGDEKKYLIPLAQVTYDATAQTFISANPSLPAVLRDPVKDGALAAWDWANLPPTVHLQRPDDSVNDWTDNVVAIFTPDAKGNTAIFEGQERDIQEILLTSPLTSSIVSEQLIFVAAATEQPSRYPVTPPAV